MRRLAAGLLSICLLPAAEKWTVDDILLFEQARDLDLSPDGRLAVYIKAKIDKEKGESVSHLFLKPLAGTEEIQLTRGQDTASAPQFSPDGRFIAFLTSRKPATAPSAPEPTTGPGQPQNRQPQIWLLHTGGGEPWALTCFERGALAFDWLDRSTLVVAAPEDRSLYDQKVKEGKDTSQVIEDETHAPPVRLFKVDVNSGKSARLTTNPDRITSVIASPDGKWAIAVHNRSLAEIYNQKIKPVTVLHDLVKGTSAELFAGQKLYPRSFQWTADSQGFYFTAPYTTHPYLLNASVTRLYYFPLSSAAPLDAAAGARPAEVDLAWDNGLSSGWSVTPDGFVALLANGARNRAARFTRAGDRWLREWIDAENVHSLAVTQDGKQVIFTHSTASSPAKWMLARLDGSHLADARPFVEFNKALAKKPVAKTEIINWTGALDEKVEGILYYPHNYEPGRKYPLVVMIHGGPFGHDPDAFRESWAYPHQLYAQRGAFILKPNYHGSSNYGLKFGESISNGNYNELEWIDVEKGVDSLISKGLVDPAKLGVLGWSNGSIITIELTTRTTRYKAAGAGAGDVNWASDWGNAVFGDSFEQYYLGKRPMDDPEFYIRKSPLFRMDKVRTPTIIFFGTEDKQVPTEQGWQHYRALQHYGQTDVKFILFPGEAHGPRKYVHQKRKVEEELAWFDKHLFGAAAEANESLKPASPLAALHRLRQSAGSPDTVERGGIAIGRFEVTRAQFNAFDPSYPVPAGTGLLPATGISFEKAKQYCEWLSKKTGQKFRLGAEEEIGGLLTKNRNENTLDQWAGYTVNVDDANKIEPLIRDAGPGALLKPVGSFAGAGDDPLYDLGGNAAEWVEAKDGSGKVMGGSADCPADAKAPATSRTDYTGFRVVRELK